MRRSTHAPSDPVARFLLRLCSERDVALATVSKKIGRNATYLSEFVRGRTPKALPDSVRQALGTYFRVDPDAFKFPDEPEPLRGPQQHTIDPQVLERTKHLVRYVIGEAPEDDAIRNDAEAAVYTLLATGRLKDDEVTLAILEMMVRRLRARLRARGEPTQPESG
ncbi:MAG TPA: hypothetical protein VEQ62_17665 [Stellaceae bacterium]|nr:hypothetical protein [Stellaceae bacterium]